MTTTLPPPPPSTEPPGDAAGPRPGSQPSVAPAPPPATPSPAPAPPDVPRDLSRPRRPRDLQLSDLGELGGAALSSLALTWLLFYQLTPLYGTPGFLLVWYVLFVVMYGMITGQVHGRLVARDRMATVTMVTAGVCTIVPLVLIIVYTVQRGLEALYGGFFTQTLETTGPLDPPRTGGALHAIIGTLEQVGIAIVLSVPLGILTAVFLNEVGGRLARPVRFIIDAMSGLPSIVAGLFIYAIWVIAFGFSGFAAALALAVLMLPTVTRTSEEMLRLVPDGLREASLALGAPQWRTVLRVVLPTARVGIVTAVILGTARAVGETAPVLLTALGSSVLNVSPFSGNQDDLPLFVYNQIRSSQDAQIARAWTGAMILIVLVLILFTLARIIGGTQRKKSRGWLRRSGGSSTRGEVYTAEQGSLIDDLGLDDPYYDSSEGAP